MSFAKRQAYFFRRKLELDLSFFRKATGLFDISDQIVKKGSCCGVNLQKSGPVLEKSSKFGACSVFLKARNRPWSIGSRCSVA